MEFTASIAITTAIPMKVPLWLGRYVRARRLYPLGLPVEGSFGVLEDSADGAVSALGFNTSGSGGSVF